MVRGATRLTDKKVAIAATQEERESTTPSASEEANSMAGKQGFEQLPWTFGTLPVTIIPDTPLASNILPGQSCNHGAALRCNARVQVAHSLVELEPLIMDKQGIVVALTLGVEDVQKEVEAFVTEEKNS